MADFTREHDRYVVLKRTDLEAHANVADLVTLGRICADINTGRAARLAQPLRAVVVESDWPEYEPTWRAIEARMRSLNEPSGDSGQLPALAQQATPDEHPDNLAVDIFANAMKSKMTISRWRGRSGWDDRRQCSQEQLSQMLHAHVAKGDPVDVANFCMMLSLRGEGILLAAPQPAIPARPSDDGLWDQTLRERDRYHEVADELAGLIAQITGVDIGEHSSANCPWQNAIEAAEEYKPQPAIPERFDFLSHLRRQREFSERTFGPGARVAGVVDHIRKELCEIEAAPGDLSEWIDVAILALDGAWRSGATPDQIVGALVAKQVRNEGRTWPDWRTAEPGKAIEHDRSGEQVCTCPSGDGSLRWPCPQHPSATGKQPLQVAPPQLWCLHVIGPDDIYPAPSKDHAEKAAELFNRTFAARAEALGITCRAEVTPWPDDAASHAAGVADFITNFLLPGWQVDPERATRVAVVSRKDLRTALDALIDIRELKAIRSLGDLPIDRLVEEFNAQMRKPDASSGEVAQLRAAEGQANG